MALKTRIDDLFNFRMGLEVLGDDHSALLNSLHSNFEGLNSSEKHEGIEWTLVGAERSHVEEEAVVKVLRVCGGATSNDVRMAS